MKKICFVVQRYGLEVNGGAELLCRQLAERMTKHYEVSVLTTKAIDYMSWKNEYRKDEEILNGVHVFRFPVKHERKRRSFDAVNLRFLNGGLRNDEEDLWFEEQGPYCPALIEAIRASKNQYEAFIFNTYLYYPSVYGIPQVREKAIFIPDAHDEPFLRFQKVQEEFLSASAILYNTEEEHQLINQKFHIEKTPYEIGGAGVEVVKHPSPEVFREKYKLKDPYIIYVGRIDEGKGCDIMFRYFREYKRRHPGPLKLLLLGKNVIPIPRCEEIRSLGFVSEEDKYAGIEGARFLLLPSRFESLSIVVLEAMSLCVPVLVNGKSDVLRGHCIRSNAGLYYESFEEFEFTTEFLLSERPEISEMRKNGPLYVKENYQWDIIIQKLLSLIQNLPSLS